MSSDHLILAYNYEREHVRIHIFRGFTSAKTWADSITDLTRIQTYPIGEVDYPNRTEYDPTFAVALTIRKAVLFGEGKVLVYGNNVYVYREVFENLEWREQFINVLMNATNDM